MGVKWRKWIRDPVFAALGGEATALAHPVWPKEKLAHSRGARGSSICADPVPGAVSGARAAGPQPNPQHGGARTPRRGGSWEL